MVRQLRFIAKLFRRRKQEHESIRRSSLTTRKRVVVTTKDIFTAFSLSFFEPVGRRLAKLFEFERLFIRAGLNVHPVKYGAEIFAITILTAIPCITGFIFTVLTTSLNVVQMVIGIMVVTVVPVIVFAIGLAYPYTIAFIRKVDTENELPFFMAYVATMVRGGYGLDKIIERVAQLKVFKAIRREAQMIITRIKMFGDDPISAVERVASNHPSTRFRDLMLGYTTTLKSGGDVVHYLETRAREILESRTVEIRATLNRLMSFLEIYTVFGVIVSITLFVFFAVSAAITAAQAARTLEGHVALNIDVTIPAFYNFFVLPLFGAVIALAIHISQPKTPVSYREVYLTVLSWAPIAVTIFIVVLIATGGIDVLNYKLGPKEVKPLIYAFSVFLIALSIPPAIRYRSVVKTHRGLIRATADFLRDISEIRKTGLSPEKCITLASSRSYRNLTPIIEKASVALSLGLSLEEALRKALRGVKEWFVVASFRFLADSIIFGGGSPEIIDSLARFTHVLSELEEETRRRMRTQVVLPYLGAVLLASAPIIILYMLLTIAKLPLTAVASLLIILALGGIINSYIMGLIAGKASQAIVAAGFIHSTILVAVTVIALTFTFAYVGL